MQIELRVFATYRKLVGRILEKNTQEVIILEVPPGTTLGQLIEKVGLKDEKSIIPLVNGLRTEFSVELSEGDRIGLFPPIGGG